LNPERPSGKHRVKANGHHFDLESDEELEAALRSELIDIARCTGVSNPEAADNMLLGNLLPGSEP
jgi:hypothetical protein